MNNDAVGMVLNKKCLFPFFFIGLPLVEKSLYPFRGHSSFRVIHWETIFSYKGAQSNVNGDEVRV